MSLSASISKILQVMSMMPTDHMEKITQICTELKVKVEELRSIFNQLKDQDPSAQFIDTSDKIIKAIEEMQVYLPKPHDVSAAEEYLPKPHDVLAIEELQVDLPKLHDVSLMPKKLRRREECTVIVRVYDQKKRIYQGPVDIQVQEAHEKIGVIREGTHKFICHTDAIVNNTLHIMAGDLTFIKRIEFGG